METNLIRTAAHSPAEATPDAANRTAEDTPQKFRDPETGALRTDAMLKSYRELEHKLARMVEVPGDDADDDTRVRFRRALGVPDRPEDYPVQAPNELVQPDPDANKVLHDAGLTPMQVQAVYDLAAQRMVPAVQDLAKEFEAERQMKRLTEHFGSAEKWREVAGALRDWGRKNLPDEVFNALSTTFEGVVAMHRMMTSDEPGLGQPASPATATSEDELRRMMADPKYWRDRDPATIKKVSEGFQKLFPGAVQS